MKPVYVIDGNRRINGCYNGKPFSIDKDNPVYGQILEALNYLMYHTEGEFREVFGDFSDLLSTASAVKKFSKGKIEVKDGVVLYEGKELHLVVTDKILEFMNLKLPFEPILNFLENVMKNPSRRAAKELYSFLEHKGLPITEDGCFLGYKGLRPDYFDIHSGTIQYSIGKTISMPRNMTDDDFGKNCSEGLHVGNYEYANSFRTSSQGKLVLVKVNPKDVVAVPSDSSCQKLRTCELVVIQDVTNRIDDVFYKDSSLNEMNEDYFDDVDEDDDYEVYDDYEDENEDETYEDDNF